MIATKEDLCRFLEHDELPSSPAGEYRRWFDDETTLLVTYLPYHPQYEGNAIVVFELKYPDRHQYNALESGPKLRVGDKPAAAWFLEWASKQCEPVSLEMKDLE